MTEVDGAAAPGEDETHPLRALGLDVTERRALSLLSARGAVSVTALADELGVAAPLAGQCLARLAGRGLASRSTDDPQSFLAVRPSVALGALMAERLAGLREAERSVEQLEREYDRAMRRTGLGELIDVLVGGEAITDRLQQLQLSARHEVLSFVKAPVEVVSSEANRAEDVAVGRGVTYRVVLERSMLEEEPRLLTEIARVQRRGELVRVTGALPTKLFVFDGETALVPLGFRGSDNEGALLIGRCGLLDTLVALFESVWQRSRVLVLPDSPGAPGTSPGFSEHWDPGSQVPDSLDRDLIALLMGGFTDAAASSALQVSLRTVQRRVRALMLMTGTDTRLQLGYEVRNRGWYAPPR